MSNHSDCGQPEITEQTEIIPIVDLKSGLAFPPPPPPPEWDPTPKHTNRNVGIIPVILGILSLLLLMLCGIFGNQYFQSVHASESKLKNLNHWIESFQNNTGNFLQIQKVLHQNKETLQRLGKQNGYLIKALQELNAKQGDQCGPPLHHWVQYRDHCYHQSVEMVSWLNCSDLCISLNGTFLKTERNTLMDIMELLVINQTWLGLSYKTEDSGWKWEDNSSPSPGLGLPEPSLDFQGKCTYAEAHSIGTDDCARSLSCMCERAVHKEVRRRM